MRKLLLIVLSVLLLSACAPKKDTQQLVTEYEEYLTEILAEVSMASMLLPIWEDSTIDSKDTHLKMFYESRGRLQDIGYNKETKELYQSIVELNEARLKFFEMSFEQAVGVRNGESFQLIQSEYKQAIEKVEAHYTLAKQK